MEKGIGKPSVGRDYPKGTGSTIRSCFAVCRWRCVSPRGIHRSRRLIGTRFLPPPVGAAAPAARTPAAITTPPVGFKYPSILPVGADDPVRPSK